MENPPLQEWKQFASMRTFHLNSQVQQYGGFTDGERVLWGGGAENADWVGG